MFGSDAVDVHNLSGIISMGETVMSTDENMDKFFNKLVDRIGKTIVRTLDLELEFPTLFANEFEFGAIIQKINVQPFNAIRNASWDVGNDDFRPTFADIYKANISVTYFKGADTWKFQTTIPSGDVLATAFTDASTMGTFITAITSAMSDSMVICINNMSRTAINNFIAEKVKAGNGVINLLTGYNALVGAGNEIDAETAMHSKEFARYASTVISEYVGYMREPSVLYNVDGIVRATARDNMHVLMLRKMRSLFDAYLLSDSFKDVYDIPLYKEVNYWQGNKGDASINDFETNSSIKVVPASEDGKDNPTDVEVSGVVCVLADRQAIAVGLNKRRAGAYYDSIDDFENISATATVQFINDLSENGVIFVINDANMGTIPDMTLKGASGTYYDHATSEYQSNITVKGNKIKGKLTFVEGGLAQSGYLSGDGYFLALSLYDNNFTGLSSVKCGLKPSQGSGLVEIKDDPDKVIVMKITDKDNQKFKIVQTKTNCVPNTQVFDLSELVLA
jgi:hypothetical protein